MATLATHQVIRQIQTPTNKAIKIQPTSKILMAIRIQLTKIQPAITIPLRTSKINQAISQTHLCIMTPLPTRKMHRHFRRHQLHSKNLP